MKIDLEKWERKFRDAGLNVNRIYSKGSNELSVLAVGKSEFVSCSANNSILIYPNDIEDSEHEVALSLLHELLDEYLKPEQEQKYYWRHKHIKGVLGSSVYLNLTTGFASGNIQLLNKDQDNYHKTKFTKNEFESLIHECMWDQFEAEEVEE